MSNQINIMQKRYRVIYADPPWQYGDKLNHHGGGADSHYDTMTTYQISRLPIETLADDDCVLFIWATWPFYKDVLTVIESWGFEYKTIGFVWLKEYSNGKDVLGMGTWTRGNTEYCLIATKGKPKRIDNNVSQLIKTQQKEHSRKPDIVRDKIVQLCGDVPRLELFARRQAFGWDVYGNDEKLTLKPLEAFLS